ncbi:MAG: hypothetical protein E7310_05040 [Clostridiales bacterium]|nr:hypothetical protein [Clostridiales bacterium]
MESEERRAYLTIGSGRLLDIRVIWEDTEMLYEGMVENAPEEIKNLRYSKIENADKMVFYVYKEFN